MLLVGSHQEFTLFAAAAHIFDLDLDGPGATAAVDRCNDRRDYRRIRRSFYPPLR